MTAVLLALVLSAPITLDEVRAASRQNLDALRAELEVARQKQGQVSARAAIFPQLSLQAQAGGSTSTSRRVLLPFAVTDPTTGQETYFSTQPGYSAGNLLLQVGLTQLIYDGGRWWNQIALSGAQERAAEGQLDEQRLLAELEAVNRFFQLLSAQNTFNVLQNAVARSQTQVERATSLYEAGRAAKLDAIDASVNLGNDRINVLRQRQSVVAAQVELLKWLGQPTREVEAVDPGTLSSAAAPRPAPGFDQVVAAAKEHRPLLRALSAQVEAGQKSVDLAYAPFLPTVSVQGAYQRQSPSLDPFFTDLTKNNALSAGLVLNWQLFNGFTNQAQLQVQRENLSQAKLQAERAELDLVGDLRRTLEALKTQLEVVKVADDNLTLATGALKLAEERFQAGAGSTLGVRDAQVKLISAQLSRAQARVDVEVARAALKRVVGAEVEELK